MSRWICSILISVCANAAIAAERPGDYAFGMLLETAGGEALYELTLPADIYKTIAHPDLRDVRVFNNAGEVVPHAWKTAAQRVAAGLVEATLYPLKARAGTNVDGVSVSVHRSAGGTTSVNVGAPAGPDRAKDRIIGYLLDLTQFDRALRAIEFDWRTPPRGFVGKLRIDGSDDLAKWRTLIADAPLVSLEVSGQRLQQKRIELPQQKVKYLRLSWTAPHTEPIEPELTSAKCEFADKHVEAVREWEKVTGFSGAKPGEYTFDMGGHFPIDRIRFDLPEPNTIAQVAMLARDRPDAEWRPVARDIAYRLQQGGSEIVSAAIIVNMTADRYWLVRVEQRGGGIGSGELKMNAGWTPHRLVFAARGAAPFQLVYGNREAKPAAYAIESILPEYGKNQRPLDALKPGESNAVKIAHARALGQRELGGERRRQDAIDWKRWSLWGSLLLGVVILAAMAWRLARQVGSPQVRAAEEPRKQ